MKIPAGSFLLIPNHAIIRKEKTLGMESAEVSMLRIVSTHCPRVGAATFSSNLENSSLTGEIGRDEIHFHAISRTEHLPSAFTKVINYLNAFLFLPFVLKRYKFIYIFTPGHIGVLAAFWARILRKNYGLYVRNTWLDKNGSTPWWMAPVFSGAKFMIVTGEAFRMRLRRYCKLVENEVPLTALRPEQIDPDRPARAASTLLFVGRLYESKGVLDAIRAVALLKQQGIVAELLIAGGGIAEEHKAIESLVSSLNVAEQVRMLGHLSPTELATIYARSSIFVFPSYYGEGFPRVLYESMMYSLAIVTCEMPGTEAFLINDANCRYSRPRDPAHLAEQLRILITDDSLRNRISGKARSDVEELYKSFMDASHPEQLLRLLATCTDTE